MGSGSTKLHMPTNRLPVRRSGMVATRSEARAKARAAEKPPATVAISRGSVAQRPTGLVELEQEAQADSRCFFENTGQESGPEVLDEALTGPQCECASEFVQA